MSQMNLQELIKELEQAYSNQQLDILKAKATEAVQNFPEESVGYFYTAESIVMENEKQYKDAEWYYAMAVYYQQENEKFLEKYANNLYLSEKWEEGKQIWANLYHVNPNSKTALFGLGQYELEVNRNPETALSYFAAISEPDLDCYEAFALTYSALEQFETALGYIDYVLNHEFSINRALTKLEILQKTQNHSLIPLVYEQILQVEPDNMGFLYEYAVALKDNKEYSLAQTIFERAFTLLEKNEVQPQIYIPYIENSLLSEQPDKALSLVENILPQIDQESKVNFLEFKAEALASLNRVDEAVSLWNEVVKSYDYNPLLSKMAQFKKLQMLLSKGQTAVAESELISMEKEMIEKGIKAKGLMKELYTSLAYLQLQKNNQDAAYFYAEKAITLGAENMKLWVKKHLNPYLKSVYLKKRDELGAQNKNANHPYLKQIINHVCQFEKFVIPVPKEISTDPEAVKRFDEGLKEFQKNVQNHAMLFTETEVFLNLPYLNPQHPTQSTVYFYEVEKEKANLMQLKLTRFDKDEVKTAKLKVEGEELVFSIDESEVYVLKVKEKSASMHWKVQRNFFQKFAHLNPTTNFNQDENTVQILELLLDY